MERKFKGSIRNGGNAFVVTVPRAYIDGDIVKVGKEYEFFIEEVKE
jgi:hypothetical protein